MAINWHNLTLPFFNWWRGAFGRRAAFIQGRDIALDHAAMIARDMGRSDIGDAIATAVQRDGS